MPACLTLLDNYLERTAYSARRAYSFAPGAPATVARINESYNITEQH